jgi:hypothetical protein
MPTETAPPPDSAPVSTVPTSVLLDLPPAPPASPSAPAGAPPAPPPADAERDSLGRPFDSAKFKPEKDSLGRWKNRNAGRRGSRPDAPAPAAPLPPVREIGPDDPPAPDSPPPPGASAPAGAAAAPSGDAQASAAHAGKLAARATYAVTGALIRDHKAAKPSPDEHAALADTWTAFFQFRGVALVGVVAVGAAVLCYLLEDGRREPFVEFVKGLFAKKREKRAEPVAPPAPASAPAPAGASPSASSLQPIRFPE